MSTLTHNDARLDVDAILRLYENDPEDAHGQEDALMERFVKQQARRGNKVARELERLIDADVTRWYA